jgi:hypothetical protein
MLDFPGERLGDDSLVEVFDEFGRKIGEALN